MRLLTAFILSFVGFFASVSGMAQQRIVELQIVSRAIGELGVQHEMMEMLSGVGADRVSIKSTTGNVRTSVTESDSGGTTSILIVGILDGRTLKLPGGRYSLRDSKRIRDYVQQLRDDGAEITLADKQAFGLTAPQLVGVFEALGGEVRESTKGQPSNRVIETLAMGLSLEIGVTDEARQLLNDSPVLEEYQGLSTGTTMAGVLRPLGLVLSPFREQGEDVQFKIAASTEVDEHWPVGWPIEVSPGQAEPKVFERLDEVSIQNFSLQETLDAIESRIGSVPFLYDQNGIARAGLDLSEINVTLVRKRPMKYFMVLQKVLLQAKPKLQLEIRKDENGKSFLWISR